MKMRQFYGYSKSQRLGIIALFAVLFVIQLGYYVLTSGAVNSSSLQSAEEKEWLAHQAELDALKDAHGVKKDTLYPFNPNYITDYKGYTLGMTAEQIDRLLAFRESGKWVNSVADFKQVTGISDSLLGKIAPYFKFPDWVVEKHGQGVAADDTDFKATDEGKGVLYPFNPNFMNDQTGRRFGMTKGQIERLKAYRESGKWINTPADFMNVTGISEALLSKMSPYFKFPDWVVRKYQSGAAPVVKKLREPNGPPIDINTAYEEDLTEIYGIGPTSAKKILRRRAALGAFVSMEQMSDFKEFSSKAIAGLKKGFIIGPNPDIIKVNVNKATLDQLARFPYFNDEIAKAIISHRNSTGRIANFNDLLKLNDIFTLKSKIISLYLEY